MPHIEIPVIGIGAGAATDGQVLVLHDLLGIREGLGRASSSATRSCTRRYRRRAGYAEEVRTRQYPCPEHTYSIDPSRAAGAAARPGPSGRWQNRRPRPAASAALRNASP